MAFNEQALKFVQESDSGYVSEDSRAWADEAIYHGSQDWFYACANGYMSPHDIYDKPEADAIEAAFTLIEGFFADYGRFTNG